jgi:hypothetical protein
MFLYLTVSFNLWQLGVSPVVRGVIRAQILLLCL